MTTVYAVNRVAEAKSLCAAAKVKGFKFLPIVGHRLCLPRCQADCGLFAEADETLQAILETASNQPVAARSDASALRICASSSSLLPPRIFGRAEASAASVVLRLVAALAAVPGC